MFDALFSLVVLGDYTGEMYAQLGIDEDHWIVDAVLNFRALFIR